MSSKRASGDGPDWIPFGFQPTTRSQLIDTLVGGKALGIRLPYGTAYCRRKRGRDLTFDVVLCGDGGGFCWRRRWGRSWFGSWLERVLDDEVEVLLDDEQTVWPARFRGAGGDRRGGAPER